MCQTEFPSLEINYQIHLNSYTFETNKNDTRTPKVSNARLICLTWIGRCDLCQSYKNQLYVVVFFQLN